MKIKYTSNDAMAAVAGRFASLSEQSIRFASSGVIAMMTAVYWSDAPAKVADVAEELRTACGTSGKGKSQAHFYADLAKKTALYFVKHFGNGATTEVNGFWFGPQEAETPDEAALFVTDYLKSIGITNCTQLAALVSKPPKAKEEVSLAARIVTMIEKALDDGSASLADLHKVTEAILAIESRERQGMPALMSVPSVGKVEQVAAAIAKKDGRDTPDKTDMFDAANQLRAVAA